MRLKQKLHLNRQQLATIVAPIAVIGAVILLRTFAVTAGTIVFEAESGVVTGDARVIANQTTSGASADSYIEFGITDPSPTPTPPAPTPTPTPTPTPSGNPPIPAVPDPADQTVIRAINDHPMGDGGVEMGLTPWYVNGKIQAVRIDIEWNKMQPNAKHQWDTVNTPRIDNFLNVMKQNNIRVLAIVLGAPKWANNNDDHKMTTFNDNDFADYVQDLMERYGDKIEAYEIWNEPDGPWAFTNPDPVRYTQILKAAYTRIKQVDSTRIVVGASLFGPMPWNGDYLKTMYQQGAKDYMDVVSVHGYGDQPDRVIHFNTTAVPMPYTPIIQNVQTYIVGTMAQFGDGNKPIWYTEGGATTADGYSTEEEQADVVRDLYGILKARTVVPTMVRVYWYTMTNGTFTGTNSCTECNYGILRINAPNPGSISPESYEPKPAWSALRDQ